MNRLSPRVILVAGWLVFVLFAYPGYLTSEAVDELIDARYGSFTDWHSPMLSEVWRLVGIVVSGPFGMLVLQSTLIVLAIYRLLRRVLADRRAAVVTVILLWLPPVIGTLAVICEEAQLSAFLLLGMLALDSPRRAVKLAGLAALLVASAMRPGAALATLPVILFALVWRDTDRRIVRYALALATWIGIVLGAAGVSWVLVDLHTDRPAVWLAELDIAGTVAASGPISDADLRTELAGIPLLVDHELQQAMRDRYAKGVSIARGTQPMFEEPTTDAGIAQLERARRSLMLAHPIAYAAHRWHVVLRVLGLSRGKGWRPLYTSFVGDPEQRTAIRHAARHSRIQTLLIAIERPFMTGVLVRPYVYLAIALLLLPLAIKRRERDAAVLLASGLLYELSLFVVTERVEFRASSWMILATVLAVALMIARGAKRPTA